MSVNSIINKVKSSITLPKNFTKIKVKLEKHAPDIMVISGVAIFVGSAVYACKKTMEAHEILEEANVELKNIEYGEDVADGDEGFDKTIARKERMKVYSHMGLELTKCYGPAIVGGVTGLGLILGAHKIQKDRNTVLAAAYTNLLTSYNSYRERVREDLGEDKDVLYSTGAQIEEAKYIDENDNVKTDKKAMVVHDDGSGHSIHARIFDPCNKNWSKNPTSNLHFLKMQQNFANDKLRSEGVVFLNDVYRMLGFDITSEGQLVGWVWDPSNTTHGDNYIDFGIYDSVYQSAEVRNFLNGVEPCVWLDFNVDGVIYDLI